MCQIDYAECDGMWLTEPHIVKARKDHRCDNCTRAIKKGEPYNSSVWKENGIDNLETCRYCEHCMIAADWLDKVCHGHLWGGTCVYEDLNDHWDEEHQFRCRSLALLLAAMRRGWEGTSLAKARSLTRYATAHAMREIGKAA
jgi:hypothetical protein